MLFSRKKIKTCWIYKNTVFPNFEKHKVSWNLCLVFIIDFESCILGSFHTVTFLRKEFRSERAAAGLGPSGLTTDRCFSTCLTACMQHKALPHQPHLKPKDSPNPFRMVNRRRPPQKNKQKSDEKYGLPVFLAAHGRHRHGIFDLHNLFQNAKSLTSSYEPSCWEICQCWSFWACPPSEKENNTKLQNNRMFWRSWWLMYVTWSKYSYHSTLPRGEDFHKSNIWVLIIFNQVNLKVWVTTALSHIIKF